MYHIITTKRQQLTISQAHIKSNGQKLESFELKGSAPVSIAAGLSWTGSVLELDKDKDGIPNALDKCLLEPEDKDGFQDDEETEGVESNKFSKQCTTTCESQASD